MVEEFPSPAHFLENRGACAWIRDFVAHFANPVRIKILCRLMQDSACVTELIEATGERQSTISQQLKYLVLSGLVEREGRLELPEADAEGDRWSTEFPVVGVSWHDAVGYCAWRSEAEGVEVRNTPPWVLGLTRPTKTGCAASGSRSASRVLIRGGLSSLVSATAR